MLNLRARLRNYKGRTGAAVRGCDDRGSALVAVMGITTAVLLVGMAIFILGHSEGDIVEYACDDARAFYIAEGGLERARGWLGDLHKSDPTADPVGTVFENQALGGGRYSISIEDKTNAGGMVAYEVVSVGVVDGVERGVRSIMLAETFSRFQWFVERGGWKWFRTGEVFEGPVHVNGSLQIDGDPWFGGRVTVGGNVITEKQGSNPTFVEGYELNVEEMSLPTPEEMEALVKSAALNGGLYAPLLTAKDSFYTVEFGKPTPGEVTYTGVTRKKNGAMKTVSGPFIRNLSAGFNGSAWFEGTVAVEGVLDGQVTLCATGDIQIWDDVLYYDSSPGNGPNPGCDDVLGLIALNDIIVSYTVPNRNDCEIHGVMMALEKEIAAEDYMHYQPRGDIIIYGGLVADYSIHLGQFDNGVCVSGYERDYRYDPRLFSMPPPFFPYTGRYIVYSWEEMNPLEA